MYLMTLDANNQPKKLIENYDSLIWTERFNTVGDFQIKAGDVRRFFNELPAGTHLAIAESNVVMEVETHEIDRPKNQPESAIIKGRSFESVLDRRVSVNSLVPQIEEWVIDAKTPSDAAVYVINDVCNLGLVDLADIFPPSQFLLYAPDDFALSTGPDKTFIVPRGNLLTTVLQFLQTEARADPTTTPPTPAVTPHGIRAVRPSASGTAVGVQIYSAIDRSASVYFDATRQLLDDGKYLFSKVGSATTAYIMGLSYSAKMDKYDVEATGLERRVILVDATASDVTDEKILQEQGSISLSEAHETALFDGSINEDLSPYKYGIHYNLGDIVTLKGDYGLVEKARVTEYIRSDSPAGSKAYPTLTTIAS